MTMQAVHGKELKLNVKLTWNIINQIFYEASLVNNYHHDLSEVEITETYQ